MNADCEPSKVELLPGLERSRLPAAIVNVFLFTCALVLVNRAGGFVQQGWLEAVLVVMGLGAAVASIAPVLPWSNAFIAAGLAAGAGGLAEAVSAVVGFPFPGREFLLGNGPLILGLFPWWLPIVWGAFALLARGSARLILYRTGEHPRHGYRVIGVATILAGGASVLLEFFATRAASLWQPDGISAGGLLCVFILHLLIQVIMTPMLIDKFPGRRPPNWLPLWVWGAANLLLAAGIVQSMLIR